MKDFVISNHEVTEFKNLAKHNKSNIMYKKVRIKFGSVEYDFIIKGVGQKAVKLELYCDYASILTNKDNGVIEKRLYDKISAIYENGKPIKADSEV